MAEETECRSRPQWVGDHNIVADSDVGVQSVAAVDDGGLVSNRCEGVDDGDDVVRTVVVGGIVVGIVAVLHAVTVVAVDDDAAVRYYFAADQVVMDVGVAVVGDGPCRRMRCCW